MPQSHWLHTVPQTSAKGKAMSLESLFFIGAFILLVALIYGVLSYRYRNREATRIGDEIVAERYRRDQT
jgi:hypothetical protein